MKVGLLPRSSRELLEQVSTGLGRVELRNFRLLLIFSILLFATDLAYEGQRYPDAISRILVVSPILSIIFVATLIPFVWLIRNISKESARSILIIGWVMLGAAAKSFTFMFFIHPTSYLEKFEERMAGDLTIAGIYIVVAAVVMNSYEYHAKVIAELNRVSARLQEQKNSQIEVAAETEHELQQRATNSLLGELERMSELSDQVLDSSEVSALKLQIQSLIKNQVRPLSRDLKARVEILQQTLPGNEKVSKFFDLVNLKFVPRLDASFIASFVIAIPNIILTVESKTSQMSTLLAFLISFSYPLLGRLFQISLPARRVGFAPALLMVSLISLVAYLPLGIFLYFDSLTSPLLGVTIFTAAAVLIFTSIASTAWFALQRNREEKAAEILRINSEIRHELDLLDQAVWVAQRKWSYIIHGTVQGALTVASSRLEMAVRPDEKLKVAVRADIERAKAVLLKPPSFDRPLKELFEEIANTWEGVCDFEYQLSPSAEAALEKSKTSTTCLVEIVKELISNANRHGGASKFWLNAYLDSNGDLSVVAGDNGKLIPANAAGGLGYEMISQLTRNLKLGNSSSSHFSATLPMPR